ncbi:MAG: HNH endonuclease, partial [Acidimicrobiales bacterium]|nr:HNH endonuclease [Acidimicrobiales bacterium]
PTEWLQADHILPWGRGGITATTNGKMRCDPCNKAKGDRIE